ncbi:nucleoside monophosphate kinase [Flavobacterium bizetiae]|uniref:adenylate kinase family protein n=1 Tax=Flavobacterium bizetiae TaxID=2704140 RepID=UPI0021E81B48|nr:nucleoside monophosphate kinase [Flavobacterium bizetiae]UTN02755.1 nucleoside monophosphate kinase [Flavobacterium bizetiae]
MEILIITGPPYSGKGTQCNVLKELLGFEHISTGDRCREEKQNGTALGKIMSEYEEKGDLVPDAIIKDLFSKILDENRSRAGIILDGYPRTKPQVDDLLELVKSKNMEIGKVINIDVPKSELLIRAKKRAETSNRKDDESPQTHLKRIEIFEEMTRPAIEYMKSKMKVLTFDGLGTIEEITERIKDCLV